MSCRLFQPIVSTEVVAFVTDAVAIEQIDTLPKEAIRPRLVADDGIPNIFNYTKADIEVQGLHLWLSGFGRSTGNGKTKRIIITLKAEEIKYGKAIMTRLKLGIALELRSGATISYVRMQGMVQRTARV